MPFVSSPRDDKEGTIYLSKRKRGILLEKVVDDHENCKRVNHIGSTLEPVYPAN